ncbi:MAG TPA: hypothetical protein ENN16_01255 [Candidatus Omnitrophica bacterium]|nr:hypothetical protein [Candidatus Omnitrophota bacterium]
MNKRLAIIVFLVCFVFSATHVYAERGKTKDGSGDMLGKFCQKVMLIVKNQEELGLSDVQVKEIKDLKMATKKDMIMKKAEIDVLALDIKAGLWEDEIDVTALNGLVDKKYEIKKEKAKSLIAAYASLKGMLTKEQQVKLKELKAKCMMMGK